MLEIGTLEIGTLESSRTRHAALVYWQEVEYDGDALRQESTNVWPKRIPNREEYLMNPVISVISPGKR